MGKLFMILGRSAVGKDTIFANLIKDQDLVLSPVVTYTTRPKRQAEEEGVQYHFVTERRMYDLEEQGKIIEKRVYHTKRGDWYYFTVDGGIDLSQGSYIMIGTLDSYNSMKDYYFKKNHYKECHEVEPIFIDASDDSIYNRMLLREKDQKIPNFDELHRRFAADKEDFSKHNLSKAGINYVFENENLDQCLARIKQHISMISRGCKLLTINQYSYLDSDAGKYYIFTTDGKEISFSLDAMN